MLIKEGYLDKNKFNDLSAKWAKLLHDESHMFLRQLFIGCGEKIDIEINLTNKPKKVKNIKINFDFQEFKKYDQETKIKYLTEYLFEKISIILNTDINIIKPENILINIGFESISSVELCNQINSDFSTNFEPYDFLENISINQIIDKILIFLTNSKNLHNYLSENKDEYEEGEL